MMGNLCDHCSFSHWVADFKKKRGHNWRISLKMYRFTGDYPSPRTWNPIFHSIPPVIVNIDHQPPADCDIKCTSGMTYQPPSSFGNDRSTFHCSWNGQSVPCTGAETESPKLPRDERCDHTMIFPISDVGFD